MGSRWLVLVPGKQSFTQPSKVVGYRSLGNIRSPCASALSNKNSFPNPFFLWRVKEGLFPLNLPLFFQAFPGSKKHLLLRYQLGRRIPGSIHLGLEYLSLLAHSHCGGVSIFSHLLPPEEKVNHYEGSLH